ncbi:hypothetical protein FACS1894161_2840 [Spirochaetia bacterium]|nr:hypothetical protein FACS1894161_2840 [Spirochaetia bacterium]
MKNNLNAAQRAAKLYRVSSRCAELGGRCTQNCGNCEYNVSLYVDDPREAVLIKTSARIDHDRLAEHISEHNAGTVGIYVFLFLLFLGCWFGISSCMKSCSTPTATSTEKKTPTQAAYSKSYLMIDVEMALSKVHDTLRDVNGDSLIDCIDYALLMHKYMPAARIIYQNNPDTGFCHLFNAINIVGWGPTFLEPQRRQITPMDRVWGSRYNPR